MPALEEGNLWVRATMPVDISFDQAARLTSEIRRMFREIARSHDCCVAAGSSGRRHRSDEFFQCRVPGQSQAGKGMASRVEIKMR